MQSLYRVSSSSWQRRFSWPRADYRNWLIGVVGCQAEVQINPSLYESTSIRAMVLAYGAGECSTPFVVSGEPTCTFVYAAV
jgi:hypothetical protein